jgi:hypothetical protein
MKTAIDHYNELMEGLKVEVKIDHNEVLKVVVKDLIQKYMSGSCEKEPKSKDAFETVLRYYLGDDDFVKYVINGNPIT